MTAITMISEALLYICFSFLFGYFILHLVPETKRPKIGFPKWLRLSCIIGIVVFSFPPVFRLVLFLAPDLGLGFTFTTVLTSFEVGKAWLYTAGMASLLFILNFAPKLEKKKPLLILSLLYLVGLAVLIGWSSHASSLTGLQGIFVHSLHFLSIMFWTGTLLLAGWFSKEEKDWYVPFLKWFTPLALVCVGVGILTGFLIMQLVVPIQDYSQSWLVSYGQALLLKHLLIIPLLMFAFLNGFLKKGLVNRDGKVNVLSWLKAEGIFVMFVFIVTGIMGQQAPPHDISGTVASEGPAKLVEILHSSPISPDMIVKLEFNVGAILFALLAAGFLLMMLFLFLRKKSSYLAILTGSLFVIASYLCLMLSIQ